MAERRIILHHLSATGMMSKGACLSASPVVIRDEIKARLREQMMASNPRFDVAFEEIRPGHIVAKLVVIVDVAS